MGRRAAIFFALFAAGPAQADFDPSAYPPYETCALCHGLFGVSRMNKFPHLGGQDRAYLDAQIRAFKSGARHNDGGQMASIAEVLSPEDIPIVVEWFHSQTPPKPELFEDTSAGAVAYAEQGCADCHDMAAELDGVPHLTAQHQRYLVKQMLDFREGARAPGPMGVDHASFLPGDDAKIEAIASYLAGKARP